MRQNVLFVFYDPSEMLIYIDEQGKQQTWTHLEGCLQQSTLPISIANIYFFREHAKEFENISTYLRNKYEHIHFSFKIIDCDQYAVGDVGEFIYKNVVTYPYDIDRYDYFFLAARHTSLRSFMFYYGISSRMVVQYMVPVMPTSPLRRSGKEIILRPMDLGMYRDIAQKCQMQTLSGSAVLLGGIATKNSSFIKIINEMENSVVYTKGPVLLYGPSGSGKTKIAQRLSQLLHDKNYVHGPFIEVNCATLNTNLAASQLFGHVKGAFTGAISNLKGVLSSAHNGVLFLDEISLLDMQCQGMLLRALEEGCWYPIGSDNPVSVTFFLICASNVDLVSASQQGMFREDLLARIAMWEFCLPSLKDRPEDIEANLDYELENCSNNAFTFIMMHAEARKKYLDFALSKNATWRYNFRDLHASVQRMAAHSVDGRISLQIGEEEIQHLKDSWKRWGTVGADSFELCSRFLAPAVYDSLDCFDRGQLEEVLRLCRQSKSMAEAGRALFDVSRLTKNSRNDSHRLRLYLQKFGLSWGSISVP